MFNHPEERCRPLPTDNADVALRMIGVLFTFVSVSYFAIRERFVSGAEPQAQVTTEPSEEKTVQDDEQVRQPVLPISVALFEVFFRRML